MINKTLIITTILALNATSLYAKKAELKFTDGGSHGSKTRVEKKVKPKRNPQDQKNKKERLLFDSASFFRDADKNLTFFLDKWGVCHYRIPQIIKCSDGRLIAAINARINQDGDGGYSTTFFAVSKNKGKTWKYIRPSTDYMNPERREKKAGQFPLFKGTQDTTICEIPKKKEFLALIHEKSSGILWASRSKDLLKWTAPYQVLEHMKGHKRRHEIAGPASAILDAGGKRIIFTVHGHFGTDDQGNKIEGNYIVFTKDGKNFTLSKGAPVAGSTESTVVGLGKRRYLVQSRSKKRVISFYNHKTGVWKNETFPLASHGGVEASLWRDKGGTIFFSTPTKGRSAGVLYKSENDGKDWEKVTDISTSGAFGYSSVIRLNKKQLVVLAERNRVKRGGTKDEYLNDIVLTYLDVPERSK